jgi:hypothetical protein
VRININIPAYPAGTGSAVALGNQVFALSPGGRVWCYQYSTTTSSTSSDNGLRLMYPIAAYNPLQVMLATEPSYSSPGDKILWQAFAANDAFGALPNAWVTSYPNDGTNFIVPDNGTYLSIMNLSCQPNGGLNAGSFPTLDTSGYPGTAPSLTGGTPPSLTTHSMTFNTTLDGTVLQRSEVASPGIAQNVTIVCMWSGAQGQTIYSQYEAGSGATGGYGCWQIMRIGDTGATTQNYQQLINPPISAVWA